MSIAASTPLYLCTPLSLIHLAQPGMKKGDVLGHEFMGFVEDVGSKVQSVKVGDRVVVSCLIFCGKCRFCKKQEYSLCDK